MERVTNAYCSCTARLLGCCNHAVAMLFQVEAAVMQNLAKAKGTRAILEVTLDVGPVSDDSFKRHHCRKKRTNY